MKVIRVMPDEGWVPVANAAARDHRLSWRARGLLLELLSYPDGWETSVDKLVAQARREGSASEGRLAMRTAMKELADLGYVTYRRGHDEHGRWTTEMVVSDVPGSPEASDRRTKNRNVGIPEPRLPGTSENQTSEDWSVTNKTYTDTVTNTDLQRGSNEHSTSLASLAAAADAATRMNDQKPTLDETYALVDRMPKEVLAKALLDLERRRARIYREARRGAIGQFKRESPGVFREGNSYARVDNLSYKYAVQHYFPDLPTWMEKPLGLLPVRG
ncbi:hypothetical protein AMIS_20590 [Actinoplanes missouriensis 431]|uniref:DNA-binding protein n=1 Tax=Actinoplanes missouriensis (strain ATCC 14538 / DSM 43046 / CBS 188.64 / JCM 3121 / NBRC 102363 / NCIMB 12654 / NRRL B-3342 / UNCC 431) TaxID=512565 RepID=I0H2P2_ACTM4|nr:hypothetical protein [Actinoplanes missouriensis]BAL87279.1 hypothetical protein AMIS_20590 [Actinoplanes missouriensis 431]